MRLHRRTRGLLLTALAIAAFTVLPQASADDSPVAACTYLPDGDPTCLDEVYDEVYDCLAAIVDSQGCSVQELCDDDGIDICEPCALGSCGPPCTAPGCEPVCDDPAPYPCAEEIVCDDVLDGCDRCQAEQCHPCWWEPALCWTCTPSACEVFPTCDGVREGVCQAVEDCLEGRICDYWYCADTACIDCGDGFLVKCTHDDESTCLLTTSYDPVGACAVHGPECYGVLVAHGFYASGVAACTYAGIGAVVCAHTVVNSQPFGVVCVSRTVNEVCVWGGGTFWDLGRQCAPESIPVPWV